MSVKTKRAIWLGSAVTFAFAGFATITTAAADEQPLSGVKVTAGVQVAQAATTPPPPEEEKAEDKKVERVVVTGSRLRKNEFTSSSPIQVITTEETTLEGLNDTSEILQGSPLAAGSQQINNAFGGFIVQGGTGANSISLRGLGAQRTLVLVNGRRVAPAGTTGRVGAPDLNVLPESMIDRIEILKDGGSSIYGSDAVAGVVNVITKKNYDGLFMSGSTNQTFEGGGATYQADGVWGETFDRGDIMVSAEYFRRDALTVGDRDYLDCVQDITPDATGLSQLGLGSLLDIIDPGTGESKCFNLFEGAAQIASTPAGGSVAGANFPLGGNYIPDPTAVAGGGPFLLDRAGFRRVGLGYVQVANRLFGTSPTASAATVFAALTPAQRAAVESAWRTTTAAVPQDDPRFLSSQVISPVERYTVFVQGSYDLFPGAEGYTELSFNRRESESIRWRQLFPTVCGSAAGVSDGNLSCTASHPSNPFGASTLPVIQVPFNTDQTVDFYRAVLGVRGEFGASVPIFGAWSYDLYYQHSRSEGDATTDFIYNDRVLATTGSAGCIQARINFSGGSCASLPAIGVNWFAPAVMSDGIFTPAEQAFLFARETAHTTYTQQLINGVVTGDAFELPAGPLAVALGFEVRWDELDDTPGPEHQPRFNPVTGVTQSNSWGLTSAGRTFGGDAVREVFGEVSVPLVAGKSWAESITFDGSARYTSYDSYGEGSTYKMGLNYQITPEYRIRGTTGTSFRAPALFEIFLANQLGFANQNAVDPCVNWQLSSNPLIVQSCGTVLGLPSGFLGGGGGSTAVFSGGGGPGVLEAETSEGRTLGFIWTPDWIDFSLAIDYWEIEVNNEVAQFGAANLVFACHTQPPFFTSPFCSLFTRQSNPALPNFGRIDDINNSFVNISSQVTDGLDVTVRYEHEFSFGTFLLNAQGTWTFTDEIRVFPIAVIASSTVNDFNGDVYNSDFNANIDLRFDHEDWTFFWNVDIASRASNNENFATGSLGLYRGTPFTGDFKQYAEFSATHDTSVRYRADDWSIVVGVQNVFDEPPPFSVSGGRVGNSLVFGGPYDVLGRRGFLEVTKEF